MNKSRVFEIAQELKPVMDEAAGFIWNNPELGGFEKKSSEYLKNILIKEGFRIKTIPEMPYAFMAEFGSGKPVVALLGEYDALPGLNQKVSVMKEADLPGEAGHGCGHNLIGTASMTAAITVKRWMEEKGINGTIRFYGCPEEELLVGKVKMVYYDFFNGTDAAITWHPMTSNQVYEGGALASTSMKFFFKGISSHASVAPEKGRSALDAAELMNIGANYLREHIIDKARVHYTTECGNTPPNRVHDKAQNWYYVRAPHVSDVREISERVIKCAEGASHMTETEVEVRVESGTCEVITSKSFADLIYRNMNETDLPDFTDEELEFAKKIQDTCDPESVNREKKIFGTEDSPMMRTVGDRYLYKDAPLTASTDVGDVSFTVPLCMFASACWPVGTAPHTWQVTSVNGTSIAHKGAFYAAKVMAASASEILENPEIADTLKKEFEEIRDPQYKPVYFP